MWEKRISKTTNLYVSRSFLHCLFNFILLLTMQSDFYLDVSMTPEYFWCNQN